MIPFSADHKWRLDWQYQSDYTAPRFMSPKEEKAIELVRTIGLIGSGQLSRLISLNQKQRKRLERDHILLRHYLTNEERSYGVFTAISPYDSGQYWLRFNVAQALRCIVFFKLYATFKNGVVRKATSPFTGAIATERNLFYVFILRQNMNRLLQYLENQDFRQRIILVVEDLSHLKPLEPYLIKDADRYNIRVTTDDGLYQKGPTPFYIFQNETWRKL